MRICGAGRRKIGYNPLMWVWLLALLCAAAAAAEDRPALGALSRQYLIDLIRIDTTNPPGHETRVARFLKSVMERENIPCELLGPDPERLNFVARLKGKGTQRPLLLMAHSDVVPADASQWTVKPFTGEIREGWIYGRGAQDDKSLLAAELAVMVELKRRNVALDRDVILLSEADEEEGSTGMQWLVGNAWRKIDAEFALNEGGFAMDLPSGTRVFQIQTSEKIPTRVVLTAHGTAGHASLPRPDNPVVHVARAITRLAEADQPVRLNATSSRYLEALSRLHEYSWLAAYIPKLRREQTAAAAAGQIRERDAEIDAQLRTTISPTMLNAGMKINVIPNVAEAQLDIRRLPNETRAEVMARVRQIVNDTSIEIRPVGQDMPATEPSAMTTLLYQRMEEVFQKTTPHPLVVPYMQRGATDGSFLRQKGMAVYGAPVFLREDTVNRAHANDERITAKALEAGTELIWQITTAVAGRP
jgi:acetylornithine deacetylase/succinyl-diaminopimelate desuccinylase-like protein